MTIFIKKVRPLLNILNTNFKSFVSANKFSVKESMISYYTMRYEFKLWL